MPPAAGDETATDYSIEDVGAPLVDINIRTAAMSDLPDGSPVIYAPTYGEPALLSVLAGGTGEWISVHELGNKTTATYTGISPDDSA